MSPEIKAKYGIVKRNYFGAHYWVVTKIPDKKDTQIRLDASLNWDDWRVEVCIFNPPRTKS